MKIKLLFILFAIPLFWGCSKDDSSGPTNPSNNVNFTINGIHDLDLNANGGNLLAITVQQNANSNQEAVTISVEDLPTGITAAISPTNGIPTFSSIISFSYNFNSAGGTFPIKIIGKSSAGRKEYLLNLTIPSANGWLIDGKAYAVNSLNINLNPTTPPTEIYAISNSHQGGTLQVIFKMGYTNPVSGTYKIVATPHAIDEVYIRCDIGSQINVAQEEGKTLQFINSGGKISLNASDLSLSTTSIGKLSIKYVQP